VGQVGTYPSHKPSADPQGTKRHLRRYRLKRQKNPKPPPRWGKSRNLGMTFRQKGLEDGWQHGRGVRGCRKHKKGSKTSAKKKPAPRLGEKGFRTGPANERQMEKPNKKKSTPILSGKGNPNRQSKNGGSTVLTKHKKRYKICPRELT